MNQRRIHWFEKFQVQLATAAVLAATYFALWPLLRNCDPQEPLTFLADGADRTLTLAIAFWAIACICAAGTAGGRPEGAMVAALIGLGGLSLRSPPMRALLWAHMNSAAALYGTLILEILLLACVVAVAEVTVGLTRRLTGLVAPGWKWRDPSAKLSDKQREELGEVPLGGKPVQGGLLLDVLLAVFSRPMRRQPSPAHATPRSWMVKAASFLALATVIATVLSLLLMRSSDRGQILFALLVSFFLGSLVSHQKFPCGLSALCWIMPVVVGVCFYALGAASSMGPGPQGWIEVGYYARALPIDWITAGGGGAMLGYWASSRIHQMRRIERQEQTEGV